MQMLENNRNDNNRIKHFVLLIITTLVISTIPLQLLVSRGNTAFAANGNLQPNINAANLFNTKTMVLPSSVKNLVILVPDEAHHSPTASPAKRFINQTYLPENAIISRGTNLVWF